MEIIKPRHTKEQVSYCRGFENKNIPGSGFSFPCDQDGNLEKLNDAAQANYERCVDGTYDVIDVGVQKNAWKIKVPAVGICEVCGKEVHLTGHYYGADQCECGQWYNMSGQALLPPEMWQEPLEEE